MWLTMRVNFIPAIMYTCEYDLCLKLALLAIISHFIAGETLPDENFVGSFTSTDLSLILNDHEGQEGKNKVFENIFKTFKRLLVPIEQKLENVTILALQKASQINQNNRLLNRISANVKTIELWLSFSPERNVFGHLATLFDNFNYTHIQTVTTILLEYHGARLQDVALPLITRDIHKFSQHIKQQSNNTRSFGVILDLKNCQQHMDTIRKLPGDDIDTILFHVDKIPAVQDDETSDAEAIESLKDAFETCRKKVARELNRERIGFISKWPISISQSDGISLKTGNMLNNLGRWAKSKNVTVVIEASFPNKATTTRKHQIKKRSASGKNIDYAWLNKPVLLNKKHIRVSLGTQSLDYWENSKFIPVIYERFRKIIVGDVTNRIEDHNYNSLKKFVETVAIFKREIVRKNSNIGGVDIFEEQDPVQITISADVSTYNDTLDGLAVKNAFDLCIFGNTVYSESVHGVWLNYEGYNNNGDPDLWEKFVAPNIKHANKYSSEPRSGIAGIILPANFCDLPAGNFPELGMMKVIIFKENVSMTDVEDRGAAEQINQLSTTFEKCTRSMEDAFGKNVKTEFRIETSGCDVNNTIIDKLANFVKFWEGINALAIKDNMVITMDTAFDEPLDDEHCGWWRVVSSTDNEFVMVDKKTITLNLFNKLNPGFWKGSAFYWVVIVVPIIVIVILLTGTASFLVIRYRRKYVVGKDQADGFFKGDKGSDSSSLNDDANSQPYNKERHEILKGSFEIDTKSSLGAGEFGIVCRGKIKRDKKDVNVAVKMLKDRQIGAVGDNKKALDGLLSEIKILSHVGAHKHIIALEGAYTSELRTGKVYVFLELCQMGSLEKHLRSYERAAEKANSSSATNEGDNINILTSNYQNIQSGNHGTDHYVNLVREKKLDDALAQDLMRWSREICSGMEHLATKKVVHADLATRNVLLDLRKCAKIADFGLSRRLYDYTNYVKKKQEPLPWRWMSPESLRRLEFNEKTDVWAFGITLWELYTLGDVPYPGLQWDVSFSSRLDKGLRCGEPHFKEEGMYDIMLKCWDNDPPSRPTFAELSTALTPSHYININAPQLK